MQRIVSIMGMPGAGKTTLGKNLAKVIGWHHLTAGDVARQAALTDKSVADALARGEMAPREKMNELMQKALLAIRDRGEDTIIDGYPRYHAQMLDFVAVFARQDRVFFHVDVPPGVAFSRLHTRHREDDTPDAIERRIDNFWKETRPIYDALGSRLVTLDGTASPDDVAKQALRYLVLRTSYTIQRKDNAV